MAFNCPSGLGSGLNAGTSLSGAPVSFGGWYNLAAVDKSSRAMAMVDTSGSHEIGIGMTSAEVPMIYAAAGGTINTAAVTTAMVPGQWYYVIGRAVTASLRYISVLYPSGAIENNSSTTTRSTSISNGTIRIGHNSSNVLVDANWYGGFAECWVSYGDVQPSATTLDGALVRHIARHGPFSYSYLAGKVILYSPCMNENAIGADQEITSIKGIRVNLMSGVYTSERVWNVRNVLKNLTEIPHPPTISRAYYPTPPFTSTALIV